MNDGGLERIEESAVEDIGGCAQKCVFVDEESLLAAGEFESSTAERSHDRFDADDTHQASEENPAGAEDAGKLCDHRVEVLCIACEVQERAANDEVKVCIWKGHGLDRGDDEPGGSQLRGQLRGERSDLPNRGRILIDRMEIEAILEHIDEIAAYAAACIEDGHAGP